MAILSYFPRGGADALLFKNMIVNATDWVASTYDSNYPYQATITTTGVTDDYYPIVTFMSDDARYRFLSVAQTGTDSVTIYAKVAPTDMIIVPSVVCYETTVSSGVGTLDETDWSIISTLAHAGMAGNIWSVGDTKSVALSGTVGTLSLNTTLYVYIIGINHRGENGITFQGFRASNSNDVALIDSSYNSSKTDGTKIFNLNHWGRYNYGGWKGCDMRYDILGSTDTAPSGYGAAPVSGSRVGYDASVTTATSTVSGTLMAALPSELRAVMRPMTVYTDNYSSSLHNTESYVTASVDYLPLLAEFEIFGTKTHANQYEQNYQSQYDYYANGGSKVKYRNSSPTTTASWWARSPGDDDYAGFCSVGSSGAASGGAAGYSNGLSPMFLI